MITKVIWNSDNLLIMQVYPLLSPPGYPEQNFIILDKCLLNVEGNRLKGEAVMPLFFQKFWDYQILASAAKKLHKILHTKNLL